MATAHRLNQHDALAEQAGFSDEQFQTLKDMLTPIREARGGAVGNPRGAESRCSFGDAGFGKQCGPPAAPGFSSVASCR